MLSSQWDFRFPIVCDCGAWNNVDIVYTSLNDSICVCVPDYPFCLGNVVIIRKCVCYLLFIQFEYKIHACYFWNQFFVPCWDEYCSFCFYKTSESAIGKHCSSARKLNNPLELSESSSVAYQLRNGECSQLCTNSPVKFIQGNNVTEATQTQTSSLTLIRPEIRALELTEAGSGVLFEQ